MWHLQCTLYWLGKKFFAGHGGILPAQVANHSSGFGSPCLLMELAKQHLTLLFLFKVMNAT